MRGIQSFQNWPSALHLGICVFTFFSVSAAIACSTVAFTNQPNPLLAYNFDFEATDAGFVLVNPPDASKRSVMGGTAARWVSRFGSITVNQIGPGMPAAGMNTKGLVITLMWNSEAVYSGNSGAPVVSELEFIQRLLDTSASVEEALSQLDSITVQGLVPIHYFLFDAVGSAAVVTPTATGLTVHRGNDLPVPALTNTNYEQALGHIRTSAGTNNTPESAGSLDRFRRAAAATQTNSIVTSAQAFKVLEDLTNPSTRWQIVFDPVSMYVNLRLANGGEMLRLDLAHLDFTCLERPLGVSLRSVPASLPATGLLPIERADLTDSMSEVLLSMTSTAHLGRPEVVANLSAGLLASSACRN
ncbi:linear amide C-N hydrolase [Labrenzia sp. DG1229]|uniref:linear amide C-N hydrolase n=1 Tax=Labrenzia sp. DG1229 TaxID=681847 RepID=UPI00048C2F6B|nr:linear amide C-N hydrolase [Labrenzia sp. DG1229]